jgi:phospholipid/cholesterol/gamma-HCH transport system substrate-binding protein
MTTAIPASTGRLARLITPRTVIVAVLALFLTGVVMIRGADAVDDKTVTAHFPRAVSIFEGSDVRILGVTVGSVTAVTPEGGSVRVDMTYDGEYDLPEDAQAVIVTPTLVSDRFIQLTPVFTTGPALEDGADIALPDTAVPIELDRIYASLRDLSATLGPNGVNADGTLNNLVTAGAAALDGQGKRANDMLRNLADAASTFNNSGGDLFETVSQLADFTAALSANDGLVRAFIQDLADVSEQLSDERVELQRTLSAVADAVGTVKGFVRKNRKALVTDVEKLSRVMRNIASERDSLNTALEVAPTAIGNLFLAYNSESGTIGSRIGISGNVFDADGFLCSIVQQSAMPKISKDLACQLFAALLEPVENELPTIPPASGRKAEPAGRVAPGVGSPASTRADEQATPDSGRAIDPDAVSSNVVTSDFAGFVSGGVS